jgi:hypothetical protein
MIALERRQRAVVVVRRIRVLNLVLISRVLLQVLSFRGKVLSKRCVIKTF